MYVNVSVYFTERQVDADLYICKPLWTTSSFRNLQDQPKAMAVIDRPLVPLGQHLIPLHSGLAPTVPPQSIP